MTLPLSTAFTESHRFWVVVFCFSFVSMHVFISSLISSMICWLFRSDQPLFLWTFFSCRMFSFLSRIPKIKCLLVSCRSLRCCSFFSLVFLFLRLNTFYLSVLKLIMFYYSIVLLSPCIEYLISVTIFPSSIISIKNVFCWSLKTIWGRRKWQPTPVLLPGKSLGQRSLAGYSPWDCRVGHDWATDTKIEEILDGASVHLIYSPTSCRKQDGACSIWEAGWLAAPPFIPSGSLRA